MKRKAKETALFILKSVIFLYIAGYWILCLALLLPFLVFCITTIYPLPKAMDLLIFYEVGLISLYLRTVLIYFTAKKLGIIKFIEKSPIWIIVLIIIIYELAVTLPYEPTSLYLAHEWKRIILNTLSSIKLGFGFIYTFLSYKVVRFLTNKYPKLSFLKNFYFLKKLENIITFENIKNKIKCIFSKFINWWKKNYRLY